jgi:hypothetical protein
MVRKDYSDEKDQICPVDDNNMHNGERLLGAELLESYIQGNTNPNAVSIR